jgi:hypothetical protein
MLQILGPTWLPKSEGVENTLLAMLCAGTYKLYLPKRDSVPFACLSMLYTELLQACMRAWAVVLHRCRLESKSSSMYITDTDDECPAVAVCLALSLDINRSCTFA